MTNLLDPESIAMKDVALPASTDGSSAMQIEETSSSHLKRDNYTTAFDTRRKAPATQLTPKLRANVTKVVEEPPLCKNHSHGDSSSSGRGCYQQLATIVLEQVCDSGAAGHHLPDKNLEVVAGNLFELENPHVTSLSVESRQLIESIWVSVKPWHLQCLTLEEPDDPLPESLSFDFEAPRGPNNEYLNKEQYLAAFETFASFLTSKCYRMRPCWRDAYLTCLKFRTVGGAALFARFDVMYCCGMVLFRDSIDINNAKIGSLLESCYKMKALLQPCSVHPKDYKDDLLHVIEACLLLDEFFYFQGLLSISPGDLNLNYHYSWCEWGRWRVASLLASRNSLAEILGVTIADFFRILLWTFSPKTFLERAEGDTLDIGDLDFKSLISIGGLRPKWTAFIGDHLRVDLDNQILYISWNLLSDDYQVLNEWQSTMLHLLNEACTLRPIESTISPRFQCSRVNLEIVRFWAMFMATDKNIRKRERNVREIEHDFIGGVPDIATRERHLGSFLTFDHIDKWHSSIYRETMDVALKNGFLPYSYFPVFSERLRVLRKYMDTRQPRGLRQIWKDDRNPLSYYTFWGVIIFGALGVFLTFCSLAVSIVQTYATFKGLEKSN